MKFDFEDYDWDKLFNKCKFRDDELKIIDLKRRGWYVPDIASELYMSESTVKRRTKRILNKIIRAL